MNKKTKKRISRQKRRLQEEKNKKRFTNKPVLSASNIVYDVSDKIEAIPFGGIGAIHYMQKKLGLDREIDSSLHLFKQHRPYFESDHILNIAYGILSGAKCIEDLGMLREDKCYRKSLGAKSLPAPTTAGDFLDRFMNGDLQNLMKAINTTRQKVWKTQPKTFFKTGIIDSDGSIASTYGEKKEGMDIAYNGEWGYHPLIITLANTGEPLYIVNRPGNRPSHDGCAQWIDRSIEDLKPLFEKIVIRGDTDFSLTENFDRWDDECTFYFGYNAMDNLKKMADSLAESDWERFQPKKKYTVKTRPRKRRENVKAKIVKKREFKNIRTTCEHIAEFSYKPTKCKKTYRIVALRKNLSIEKGESAFLEDIRYFFYITNDKECSKEHVVQECRDRCNQENEIEQLKNGVHALKAPKNTLEGNWAWMVIASLAWSLKIWFGLLREDVHEKNKIVRMEFRKFQRTLMTIPAQIVKSGRRLVYKILGYSRYLEPLFRSMDYLSPLRV